MPSKEEIRQFKERLKSFADACETKLSYSKLERDVRGMMALGEQEKKAAFKNYFLNLAHDMAVKSADFRGYSWSSEAVTRKMQEKTGFQFYTQLAYESASGAILGAARLIDPTFNPPNMSFGATPDEMRDSAMSVISGRTYFNMMPVYMKRWDREVYNTEIEQIRDSLKNYTFTSLGNKRDSKAQMVAQTYFMKNRLKDELASHGRVWRFFNFRKVAAYRSFISEADAVLTGVGFDEQRHGEEAMSFLKRTLIPPFDIDEEKIQDLHENLLKSERIKNIEELTVARQRLEQAKELDKNPETSLYSKVEHIYKKHGLDIKEVQIGWPPESLDQFANEYDKIRDLDSLKNVPIGAFFFNFKEMYIEALKKGGDINVAEIIKDANDIAVIVSQQYTLLYDLPEAEHLLPKVFFGGMTTDNIVDRIEFFSKGLDVSPEKLEQLKQEAAKAVNEMRANPEKLVADAKALAAKYAPKVEVKEEKVEIKEEKIEIKEEKIEIKEEKAEIKEEKAEVKADQPKVDEAKKSAAKQAHPGDKLFKIGYRPDMRDFNGDIALANSIAASYVKNNPNLSPDAKKVFTANFNRIRAIKAHIKQGSQAQHNYEVEWANQDKELNNVMVGYSAPTISQLEAAMPEKQPIVVDLGGKESEVVKQKVAPPPPSVDKKLEP